MTASTTATQDKRRRLTMYTCAACGNEVTRAQKVSVTESTWMWGDGLKKQYKQKKNMCLSCADAQCAKAEEEGLEVTEAKYRTALPRATGSGSDATR